MKFRNNFIKFIHQQYSKNLPRDQAISSYHVRQQFLDYFIKENNHQFIRSSPVVPFCDPTVAFVNAGMNQFKNIFLGTINPPYRRIANSQKCVRVGGKHNDLSVVGTDGYHHTFFEMLGNWSFGDYFKREACTLAWHLITGPFQIDPNRLYVTYFGGDEMLQLNADIECVDIWRSLGVPKERIIPFGCKENFWEMGLTGPCGPCSEIHIDHITTQNRKRFVNAGLPDLTELWNIVFIQYNRNESGSISPLPENHIDTGMGLERLVALLQGKGSNYDTDLFTPLFDVIQNLSKSQPYSGTFETSNPSYQRDTAYRILADHSRMITVCLADGMFPDQNHKLRRVLRRAILLCEKSFRHKKILHDLVPTVSTILSQTYPEMQHRLDNILQIIAHEEEIFQLLRGNCSNDTKEILSKNPLLEEADLIDSPGFVAAYKELQRVKNDFSVLPNKKILLPGDFIFKLYDTYGLDEEAIQRLAMAENLQLDIDAFEDCLKMSRERTKLLFSLNNEPAAVNNLAHLSNLLNSSKTQKTDDSFKYHYNFNRNSGIFNIPAIEAKIVGIIVHDKMKDFIKPEHYQEVRLIFDKSNFYCEAGGQQYDIGLMSMFDQDSGKRIEISIEKVQQCNNCIVHIATLSKGVYLSVGDTVTLHVDNEHRTGNIIHHSATHLLNASVRKVTKSVVYQKSSSVTNENLKLELGIIGTKLDREIIYNIEQLVREIISDCVPVKTKIINAQQLLELNDVTLVPGEVYPEIGLRLLEINQEGLREFKSKELCCGTHVKSTDEILEFCLTNVKLMARGTYSFSAVCGKAAKQAHTTGEQMLQDVNKIKLDLEIGKQKIEDLEARVQRLKYMLLHGFQKNLTIPHIVKIECLEILNGISKKIKDFTRESLREFVGIEMKNILDNCPKETNPFIIHFLSSSSLMESVPLQKATKLCTDRPILVISLTDGLVKARCCVPKEFMNKDFTAEKWLKQVADLFCAQTAPPKGQNTNEVCNMKAKKVKISIFEEQLEDAITIANKYATKHM